MSIISEYVNHANTEIPYINRDDLVPEIFPNGRQPDITTKTVNGREVNYRWLYTSFGGSWGLNAHISDYLNPEEVGVYKTHYALKSKKENSEYNYITFNTARKETGYLSVIMSLSKTETFNPSTDKISIGGVSTSFPRGYIAILEIGDYICLGISSNTTIGTYKGIAGWLIGFNKSAIEDFLGEVDGNVYDTEFGGISDADGYNPNFDNSSDIIPVPNMPSIGVSNVGFVNVYKTSQGALQNLGADIFPDFEEIPEVQPEDDTLTMLANGFMYLGKNITTLLKSYINSNLINYIIDCHCLPVTPTTGESEQIKIGFKEFPQTATRVTSDYVDFDCGTLNLKEYYGNFIDYVGTRASLYLPFIGFVPIKNEYFQNGALTVKYRFNIIDGSFMCYVLATSSKSNLKDTVIGTYSGNACVHIPITGVNYANMVSGVVSGVSGAVVGGMSGNVGMAVGSALSTLSCKPEMQSSNSYNATSSFLGIRYPYLLIEREVSNFSELYPNEYGLPLNVTKTISELTGYIEMDENIHIEINCMNEEKEMLKELLTGGIII